MYDRTVYFRPEDASHCHVRITDQEDVVIETDERIPNEDSISLGVYFPYEFVSLLREAADYLDDIAKREAKNAAAASYDDSDQT